jgi:hypothetical protein
VSLNSGHSSNALDEHGDARLREAQPSLGSPPPASIANTANGAALDVSQNPVAPPAWEPPPEVPAPLPPRAALISSEVPVRADESSTRAADRHDALDDLFEQPLTANIGSKTLPLHAQSPLHVQTPPRAEPLAQAATVEAPALRPPAKPPRPSAPPPAPSEPEAPLATVAAPEPLEPPIHTRQTAIHPPFTPEPEADSEPETPNPVFAPPVLDAPVLAPPVLAPPVLAPPVLEKQASPLAAMLPDADAANATSPSSGSQRQAFRACIELSQEAGTYLLRMLPSGEAAPFGTYEAMVVLVDPNSDFFNAT